MAQAAAQRVGYANGGDTGPSVAPSQPGNALNHRASLLAGLRKRYDAMIAMAQGALAHRDENAAVRFAQRAHDMVPDGKSLILHVQPDGNVLAIVHDPRGGEQSRHVMTPDQFHHYLIGPATSFDHVIDNGVGHNLGIASGKPTPRTPDHPADPIHKVRQVLQHTRKMFGVDKIGQAPPRIGYAAGGPVHGYDDGGEVDDTPPPDPAWTAQDERDNPPPPEPVRETPYEMFMRGYNSGNEPPDPGTEPTPIQMGFGGGPQIAGSLDDYILNAQRGAARAPAQSRPASQIDETIPKTEAGYGPVTSESGIGELLKRAAAEKWNRNLANAPQSASIPGAIAGGWDSVKQALADYVNGTNAASTEDLSRAKQNEANQNPNLSTPEVVQNIIAGPPDPNVNQLPTAETRVPITATTSPQVQDTARQAAIAQAADSDAKNRPASWADTAGYAPRTGYFQEPSDRTAGRGGPQGGPQQVIVPGVDPRAPNRTQPLMRELRPDEIKDAVSTFIQKIGDDHGYLGNGLNLDRNKKGGGYTLTDQAGNKFSVSKDGDITGGGGKKLAAMVSTGAPGPDTPGYGVLPRQPSKEDLRPVRMLRTPNGNVPVNRNGEIIKPDGTLEYTPGYQSQQTVVDRNTGEVLPMTGGTGIPNRPRAGTPSGTGVRGSLNRPFGFSAKDQAYQNLSTSGALDIVPSDRYGRSAEQQASEGARPWTQDMSRPIGQPMPRGAPPMYVTEKPQPYYDPSTGQVVTPDRQVMPGSGAPVGVAPGSPEAGKPPAWQPPPNIPGAVGAAPPADDQSPAARAARAFPMASQTRQRVQYQGTLERQGQEDQLKREGFATRDTPESRMARAKLADDGKTFRSLSKDRQTQYHTDMQGVIADNNRFERAREALERTSGQAAGEFFKNYRNGMTNNPNYKPTDDELGAMSHAHDLIFGNQGAAPPAQVPKPVAPLPQGGAAPATPAQQSPNSVLRVPPAQQNLPSRPSAPPPPVPAGLSAQAQWSPSRQQWRTPDGKLYDRNGRPVGP